MNAETATVLQACARQSISGEIDFPEVVRRCAAAGVERYHADYSRGETTYYLTNGDSLVVPLAHDAQEIAQEFSAPAVAAAVKQSQRGEHTYREFVAKTMAAGCVGYFVQITGRRVIYFGRTGDSHVELMP